MSAIQRALRLFAFILIRGAHLRLQRRDRRQLSAMAAQASSWGGDTACRWGSRGQGQRRRSRAPCRPSAAVDIRQARAPAAGAAAAAAAAGPTASNQHSREGSYEAALVDLQASKGDGEQPSIASMLAAANPATATVDVVVVGCGPAGLALAAELGKQGLMVLLVSKESKFVNNYGVWLDEFRALGLENTLDHSEWWGVIMGWMPASCLR